MHQVDGRWRNLPRGWALAGLFAANLAPLAGVVALGWNAGQLLAFYWLESGLVGAVNLRKILLAEAPSEDWIPSGDPPQFHPAAFFAFIQGGFWILYGVFVAGVATVAVDPGGSVLDLFDAGTVLALGTVAVGQAVEYWTDYIRGGRYRRRSPAEQVNHSYWRGIVPHVIVIVGGVTVGIVGASPVGIVGSPLPALVLLVGLKFSLDLGGYQRQLDCRG